MINVNNSTDTDDKNYDCMPEKIEKINIQEYGNWAHGMISYINELIEKFNSSDISDKRTLCQQIKKETDVGSIFHFCCID